MANTQEIKDIITEGIWNLDPDEAMIGQEVSQITDFSESGLLTSNEGLVITLADGSEFQLTIVQSR